MFLKFYSRCRDKLILSNVLNGVNEQKTGVNEILVKFSFKSKF